MGQIRLLYKLVLLIFSAVLLTGVFSSQGFTINQNQSIDDSIQKFTFGLVQFSSATHIGGFPFTAPGTPAPTGDEFDDGFINGDEDDAGFSVMVDVSNQHVGDVVELLRNGASFTSAKTNTLDADEIAAGTIIFGIGANELSSEVGQGDFYFSARVLAGSEVSPTSDGLGAVLDTTLPTGTITITDDYPGFVNSLTEAAVLSCNDGTGSGCALMNIDGQGNVAFFTSGTTALAAGADGPRTSSVVFTDLAGNPSTGTISDGTTLDTTGPTGTITITDDYPGFVNSLTEAAVLSCNDGTGSGCALMNIDGQGNVAFFTSGTTALAAGADGPRTSSVVFTDNVGNPSTGTISDGTTLDTTKPATVIDEANIDDGLNASRGGVALAQDGFTQSLTIDIPFSASDGGSGVQSSTCVRELLLDVNGDTPAIPDSESDIACTSVKSYASLAQGKQKVTIHSIDNVDNEELSPSFSWFVDTTAPTFTVPPDVRINATASSETNSTSIIPEIAIPTVTDNLDPFPTINDPRLNSYGLGNTTLTWNATDAAGNFFAQFQNVTVAKVNITSTSDSTPRWDVDELVISGKVFGFFAGDEIMVRWGDGSNTNVTSFTGGDGNTGADWTAEHNYTAAFSGQTLTVNATLVENPDIAISNNVLITVIPHLTSLIIDSLSDEDVTEPGINVRWDRDFNATVTVTDTEAGGDLTGTVDGLEVQFKGNALNATSIFTDNVAGSATSASVITTLTANGTGSVGLQGLFANFTGTAAYVESGAFTLANITKHNTLTEVIFVENVDETDDNSIIVSVPWDWFFNATAKLTDLDSAANQGQTGDVGGKTINYTLSTAIGPSSATIFTTDGSNPNSTTTMDTLTADEAGNVSISVGDKTVVAVFAGDDNYKLSTGINSTTITKHHSSLILNTLLGVPSGSAINAAGLLTDLNMTVSEEPGFVTRGASSSDTVEDETIMFEGNGTTTDGTITGTKFLQNDITEGVDISGGSAASCGFCTVPGTNILNLGIGGTIDLPTGIKSASLHIQNVSSGTYFQFNITRGDGIEVRESGTPPFNGPIVVGGTNIVNLLGSDTTGGIRQIEITNVTSGLDGPTIAGGTVGISFMDFTNATAAPSSILQVNVTEDLATGTYSPFTIKDGSYSSTGNTSNLVLQNLNVTSVFDETADFFGSSDTKFYDLRETTVTQSGIGGTISIAPDSGEGFTAVACSLDSDNDSICDEWETPGTVPYTASATSLSLNLSDLQAPGDTGSTVAVKSLGGNTVKDVFVEIDYMNGHYPNEAALNVVIDAFSNSPEGIRLHVNVDESLTHVRDMNMWRDNDNIIDNDFLSIKNRHFGPASDHATAGTPPTVGQVGGKNTFHQSFFVDMPISTPPGFSTSTPTEGTITAKFKLEFYDDPFPTPLDVSIISLGTTSQSGEASPLDIANSAITHTITPSGPSQTKTLTVKIPFSTVGPNHQAISTPSGGVVLPFTINTPAWLITTLLEEPYVTTTKDNARAQVTHYAIIGHNLGQGCGGPSGIAETPGNDFAIGLGCNWGPLEDPAVFEETPPFFATVGNGYEQAGSYMHELGHNLGLLHGGPQTIASTGFLASNANANCKPNYLSVMSYARQTNIFNAFTLDYSRGQFVGQDLDETNLSETTAYSANDGIPRLLVIGTPTATSPIDTTQVSGVAIDWNNDDAFVSSQVADINNLGFNGCSASPNQTLIDHDDWSNIVFNFRGSAGGSFDGIVPLDPFTKTINTQASNSYDWYDGLYKYHTVHSNPGNEVTIGENAYFLFQYLSCGSTDIAGQPDTCIDTDKVVKQNLFYTDPNQNGEVLSGDPDEQELVVLTGRTIKATITQISTGNEIATLGPFHEAEGQKGFYFFAWNTNDPAVAPPAPGEYAVTIFEEYASGETRILTDLNLDPQFRAFVPSLLDIDTSDEVSLILEVLGGGP